VTTYVPPEKRARDAAQLYLDGRPFPDIATSLCVDRDTANRLVRTGLERLAADRLQQLLGEHGGEDWLDSRVTDYTDNDLLDPDAALMVVALAVCTDDAMVLADIGQRWTLWPEWRRLGIPPAVTITALHANPPRVDLQHDDGDQEHEVDLTQLVAYRLAAWDREDQDASR
jgi:hypothetical protein